MYKKIFHIETVLRLTLVLFYKVFWSTIKKSLIFSFKYSEYLFYRFNNFIKVNGNRRYKLFHTRKMLDTVGLQKVEQKYKQFLIEKIIHGVEFKNFYGTDSERKPEIMSTIEGNYRIARRVYQQLHLDSAELFAEFIRSLSFFE